jgi:hypothetical protein
VRTKEFLGRHGIPFVSVNIAEKQGLSDFKQHGFPHVPVVARGKQWVDGLVIQAVAEFLGVVEAQHEILPPAELARRVDAVLAATWRMTWQLPADKLKDLIPLAQPRQRTYIDLVAHIGLVIECIPELLENGRRVEIAHHEVQAPSHVRNRDELIEFIAAIRDRFNAWWAHSGTKPDYQAKPDVYYDEPSLHSFFERTTWHGAQHARQLAAALEDLGITPDGPLTERDLAGLPMPASLFA